MRIPLPPAATAALRRFAWMFLAFYGMGSIALWAAHLAFPGSIGPVTEYTISISLIIGFSFGALYAAASVLRPSKGDQASSTR
jgi:hypothetical protein